jgi:hypothetical protein
MSPRLKCSRATSARLSTTISTHTYLRPAHHGRAGLTDAISERCDSAEPHPSFLRRDEIRHPRAHQHGQSIPGPQPRLFYSNPNNTDTHTTKIDHRFSSSDSISGRYTGGHATSRLEGGRFGSPAAGLTNGFGSSRSDSRVYNASITETHMFSPTFIGELLVAVNRNPNGQGTLADFTDWAGQLGLPNPFGVQGWPTISARDFQATTGMPTITATRTSLLCDRR